MEICTRGLASGYEIEHLARLFFPGAKPRKSGGTGGALVYARASARRLAAGVRLPNGSCRTVWAPRCPGATPKEMVQALSRLLYQLLKEATGLRPPWGMLTGVRPLSLLRKQLAAGGEEQARRHLLEFCDVSPEKFALLGGVERLQRPILAQSGPASYSLYVSIPFCPSRCAYCSFVSRTIEREAHLMDPYVERLCEELALTAQLARQCGLRLSTIYVGGGTPTALNAAQLERLLAAIAEHYDVESALEYTVEAGRPDCTDAEKLSLLARYGVSRISVNPQSMHDDVLRRIGRRHTAGDIRRCVDDARKAGHQNLNMDLIAGLPGDDAAGFIKSLREVLALAPENITLHSLTMKRASNLVLDGQSTDADPAAMLDAAAPLLAEAGYRPYYLYRQKSGVQNLENTGWTRPGHEGLYNIFMMEEAHSILAVGAGAATKLVKDGGSVIRRRYNHKLPLEYLEHFDEILQRKRGVRAFYAGDLDSETAG